MSDTEEQTFYFGTPLDPYDEDAFPKKRPIPLEDQVAKDAQGRRRFHGAFTGGFSAGFFNTVGSVQGWTPREFKSSRSEKAANKQQRPEDFMDEEDLGEFGIAPQAIRATKDYSTTSKKRKKQIFGDGLIPGEPVLDTLLQAGNETVGYFLMKNMNRKQKAFETTNQSGPKVYGCVMPKDLPEETFNPPQYNLHEIYEQYLKAPKVNTFGLSYVSLDKTDVRLFESARLTVQERNNKKLSISGQAFGVGAFEDEDDDIYVKDNMSRYDFELTAENSKVDKKKLQKGESLVLDTFVLSKNRLVPNNEFPPPVIPASFTGKHNVKKSRFEPLPQETETPDRRNMNASVRAKYLGEDHTEKVPTPSNQQHNKRPTSNQQSKEENVKEENPIDKKEQPSTSASGLIFDRFVSAKQEDDPTNILEEVKSSEITHGTKEMHAAVKLKMFGPLTRTTLTWHPCSLLCKRFNVPEGSVDELNAQKNKKRTKNLIFEYQKHAENNESLYKPGLSLQANTEDKPEAEIKQEELPPPSSTSLDNVIIKEEVTTLSPEDSTQHTEETSDSGDNKIIDLTDRVDVSKNTDLFKAVFLSSSESESEDETAEEKDEEKKRKETLAANVVSEPLVPKIKSTREGILSNIDFSKFNSFSSSRNLEKDKDGEKQPEETISAEPVEDSDSDTYGPRLPTIVSDIKPVVIDQVVNNDEWVEKDSLVEKRKKHKKKHKKDKNKHKKKHKHKSKR